MTRVAVVTGSASGIGAAVCRQLEAEGDRVIRVDRHDADVVVDLASPSGRNSMGDQLTELADGRVDAAIACAGIFGTAPDLPIVQVNYFGAVATLVGLRPLLQRAANPRAVVVSSSTVVNTVSPALVGACQSTRSCRQLSQRCPNRHDERWLSRGATVSRASRAIASFPWSQLRFSTSRRHLVPRPNWLRKPTLYPLSYEGRAATLARETQVDARFA